MTLIALVGAISTQGSDKRFILLAFIPILGFWALDSFYLQQERKYKQLYKNVAEKDESQIDFNLDTRKATGTTEEMKRLCICSCFFSITELCFYPIIAAALIMSKLNFAPNVCAIFNKIAVYIAYFLVGFSSLCYVLSKRSILKKIIWLAAAVTVVVLMII